MALVKAITCYKCNHTIFSRARHDMRGCYCGSLYIDGGLNYVKIAFDPEVGFSDVFDMEVEATAQDIYQDWRTKSDVWGLIPPDKGK